MFREEWREVKRMVCECCVRRKGEYGRMLEMNKGRQVQTASTVEINL